jgi:hypothetical protein
VNASRRKRDVVFLVADRNIEAAVDALLSRPVSLAIRPVEAVIRTHPDKDPGCYLGAHDFLRAFPDLYAHAIVIFDREGCGKEDESRETLEADVEDRLARNGWAGRARTVVIDPELESWVWSDSPEVDNVLGWSGRSPRLRRWLTEGGFLREDEVKPARPKEAMEAALRLVRKPRSSVMYRELAERVSLRRCTDSAFQKLITTLQTWFPPDDHPGTQGEDL